MCQKVGGLLHDCPPQPEIWGTSPLPPSGYATALHYLYNSKITFQLSCVGLSAIAEPLTLTKTMLPLICHQNGCHLLAYVVV